MIGILLANREQRCVEQFLTCLQIGYGGLLLAIRARSRFRAVGRGKGDKWVTTPAAGDRIGSLRIAARFFDRSSDTKTFKRGMDAYNNPGFYWQLGKDPEQLMAAALELLAKKFRL